MPIASSSAIIHARCAASPLDALYRIFVYPALAQSRIAARTSTVTSSQTLRFYQSQTQPQPQRTALYNPPVNNFAHQSRSPPPNLLRSPRARPPPTPAPVPKPIVADPAQFPHLTLNEAIGSSYVNIVDEQRQIHRAIPLREVLSTFDRKTHHLVKVADAQNTSDPRSYPTCKVISVISLRQHERAKQAAQKAQKRSSVTRTKTIELNWAVDPNDLSYKLKMMKDFLEEGRKVEVILAKKRRTRDANHEECEHLVEEVQKVAAEVKGVKEWMAPDGAVGSKYTLFFKPSEENEGHGTQVKKEKKKGKMPKVKAPREGKFGLNGAPA